MKHGTIDLSEDVLFEILLLVDIKDVVNLSMSNASLKDVLSNPQFLNKMAIVHCLPFSETFDQLLDYAKMSPKELTKLAVKSEDVRVIDGLIERSVYYILNIVIVTAARYGHQSIITHMIELGLDFQMNDYMMAMVTAARRGYQEIVDQMIKLGVTDYNQAMVAAAEGGYQEIVNQMLKLGPVGYKWDYGVAMVASARGGHQGIVNQMLKLCSCNHGYHLHAIIGAAYNGHQAIVNLLLPFITKTYYNLVMAAAAGGGHQEIINQMLKLGANGYDQAMMNAKNGGHQEIINQMIKLEANRNTDD